MINRKIYQLQAQEKRIFVEDKKTEIPGIVIEPKKPRKLRNYTPLVWEVAAVAEIKNETPIPEGPLKERSKCVIL